MSKLVSGLFISLIFALPIWGAYSLIGISGFTSLVGVLLLTFLGAKAGLCIGNVVFGRLTR